MTNEEKIKDLEDLTEALFGAQKGLLHTQKILNERQDSLERLATKMDRLVVAIGELIQRLDGK